MGKDQWDQVTGYCCGTCKFYSPKENDKGRCRRHAPTMAGFPVVYCLDDWCGDHKIPVVYCLDDWCGDHKIGTNPHKISYKKEQ